MNSQQNDDVIEATDSQTFAVGEIVHVQARTWPGINKPGGIARITQLHSSSEKLTDVDVQYVVVGGRERRVPIEYVSPAPSSIAAASKQDALPHRNELRDRSMLLGRCRRCGSLRKDCGSCDWLEQERLADQAKHQPQDGDAVQRKSGKTKKRPRKLAEATFQESSSASSSDEELLRQIQSDQRRYQRQKAAWDRTMETLSESSHQHSDTDSSSSDDRDPILARLSELSNRRRRDRASFLRRKYSHRKRRQKKRSQKRVVQTGLSSLESLQQPVIRDSTPPSAMTRHSTGRGDVSPTKTPLTNRQNTPQTDETVDANVEDVGDPDLSQATFSPSQIRVQSEATEESVAMDYGQDGSQGMHDEPVVGFDLEGVGFIQPEGSHVAENLPEDIVDRTKSVQFKDLPLFFDDLVAKLSNDIIPDAGIDVADFQRRSKEARRSGGSSSLTLLAEEG